MDRFLSGRIPLSSVGTTGARWLLFVMLFYLLKIITCFKKLKGALIKGCFWPFTSLVFISTFLYLIDSVATQKIRLRAVSLSPWFVEKNARDTQMTTRVTEGARQERPFSFLASGGFAAQRSRARALPLLNQKKKRGCLLSTQKPVTCPPCESPIAQWSEVPGRSWVWFSLGF